jgi:SAM-dependent methyltransferase
MRSSGANKKGRKAASAASAYGADLAYIHDAGFGSFADAAAKELLARLGEQKVSAGLVVDLGCGSGILAEAVSGAGYDVLGFDISRAMIELARRRAPRATFRHGSALDAKIPSCIAVTAIGEVFNYLFDPRHSLARIAKLFARVHRALVPRGLFLFDAAIVGRVPEGKRRGHTEAEDWACLYEAEEDPRARILTRRITTFRRAGATYRREAEVHKLHLFEVHELLEPLRKAGFRARLLRRYADLEFPPGYVAFAARKA